MPIKKDNLIIRDEILQAMVLVIEDLSKKSKTGYSKPWSSSYTANLRTGTQNLDSEQNYKNIPNIYNIVNSTGNPITALTLFNWIKNTLILATRLRSVRQKVWYGINSNKKARLDSNISNYAILKSTFQQNIPTEQNIHSNQLITATSASSPLGVQSVINLIKNVVENLANNEVVWDVFTCHNNCHSSCQSRGRR